MNFIDKLLFCRQRLEGKRGLGWGLPSGEGSLKYVERYLKGGEGSLKCWEGSLKYGEGSLKCVTNHKKVHLWESSE